MRRHLSATLVMAVLSWQVAQAQDAGGGHWPQFRGPQAGGVSDGSPTPTQWDVAANKNIAWKTAIPGLSHSSPIVWGDRLFVTTAVAEGRETELKIGLYGAGDSADDMVAHAFKLYCLDARDGKVLWERTCTSGVPKVKRHTKATHCNTTPATDGRRVVAFFGSEGLYCFSVEGAPLWQKDLGVLDVGPHDASEMQWGFASSPILSADRVVVQCDTKKSGFLAAFDANDGRELWRTPRQDVPGWATPTAYGAGDDARVLVNGCKHIGGYELATGKEVWRTSGGGGIPVPTPVIVGDVAYFTSNHRPIQDSDPPQPLFCVNLRAKGEFKLPGDQTGNPNAPWMRTRRGAYMQTPIVYRGLLYNGNDNGVVTAYDAESGEEKWRQRLGEGGTGFTASAVAGDGKLYYTSEEGQVYVLKAGPTFEQLAINALGASCLSTPAISKGVLYFHTRGALIAVR